MSNKWFKKAKRACGICGGTQIKVDKPKNHRARLTCLMCGSEAQVNKRGLNWKEFIPSV